MPTIQWRTEFNALTTPPSYSIRYVPRVVLGYEELAIEVARMNPLWDKDMVKAILQARDQAVMEQLIMGNQITLKDSFRYRLSFHGRLNDPDETPTDIRAMTHVTISASRKMTNKIRQDGLYEQVESTVKAPVILSSEDTVLLLNDVLYGQGVLRLTGTNLAFDPADQNCGCTLAGTRSGSTLQTQFAQIANTEIMVVPHIPSQDDSWNNEYTVTVRSRYTEHGTIRTGIYNRRLRTPLVLSGFATPTPIPVGVLTGDAATPYVLVTQAIMSTDTILRLQAAFDATDDHLELCLLDMQEAGQQGAPITVPGNGAYTVPGIVGSTLSSLAIQVNNYTGLVDLIRNHYSGRMVDILDIRM